MAVSDTKYCKDCKHHIVTGYQKHRCTNPKVGACYDPVTGAEIYIDCYQARGAKGQCPEGIHWEKIK